jgi:release factor glutamine methyltransferase
MAEPKESWTILEILRWTTEFFGAKEVSEPRTSAEVLLAHILGVSRLELYLRYDQPLNPTELSRFKALVVRRRQGEPVAYLTGHREFWSLDILVTPAVLIPRPETETLVEAALAAAKDIEEKDLGLGGESERRWGLEAGVGSGAVIIALAKELASMAWVGLDLSKAALAVARENSRRQGVSDRVHLLQGDLLTALKPMESFDLLVANLPYVPRRMWESLPREIKEFEPAGALLGGEDGLDLIRPLIRQAEQYVLGGGWVVLEVGDGQAPAVAALLEETGAYERPAILRDFSGIERVVQARRREGAG